MKKIIAVLLCFGFVFALDSCSIEKTPILDNSSNSYFVDFYTDDDYVYIECVLNIYNPNNTEAEVTISAIDNEDVDEGQAQSFVEKLTGRDSAYFWWKLDEAVRCGLDTTTEVTCPNCNEDFDFSYGISSEFFRPKFDK